MVRAVAVAIVLGCALLTGARISAFSSDEALWRSAYPSEAPRVSINIASALLISGQFDEAGLWSLRAWDLAQRPQSAYERQAVFALVQHQIQYLNAWTPVCSHPAYSPFC
jgi:hypothetical protein